MKRPGTGEMPGRGRRDAEQGAGGEAAYRGEICILTSFHLRVNMLNLAAGVKLRST